MISGAGISVAIFGYRPRSTTNLRLNIPTPVTNMTSINYSLVEPDATKYSSFDELKINQNCRNIFWPIS